ncbi:cobalt-precorrin 5A hydrolase [Azospirillaceae bacterium]
MDARQPATRQKRHRRVAVGRPGAHRGWAPWLESAHLPRSAAGPLVLRVTDRAEIGNDHTLIYHPPLLVVGVGCERGADPHEALDLVHATLRDAGLAEGAVAAVVSVDLKADEPAIHTVAAALKVPARFFDAPTLEAETPRLETPSEVVFQEIGCHGVAEAAALAATGVGGRLLVSKRKSARVTCAVARAPGPLDASVIGRRRGRLAIVGLGPGQTSWRTPEVDVLLRRSQDLVGYRTYLDMIGPLAEDQTRHDFDLGAEEARCRAALELAATGRAVALVSSGDPGIYAMATLVFELLGREERPDWRRVEIIVSPGISALQAAAARAGAPLGHDFCAISLSDLLTPWEIIENGSSRRRRTICDRALQSGFSSATPSSDKPKRFF